MSEDRSVYTDEERQWVAFCRGLKEEVLEEFNELDRKAIAAGQDRFIEKRKLNLVMRARVLELRQLHSLHIYQKLPRLLP